MLRKLVFCVLALSCLLPLAAQEADGVENVIIRELSRSADRDSKQVALRYIEDAVSGGNTGADIVDALKSLAGEGLATTVLENGRIVNNYPEIRLKACELLGRIGTADAVPALLTVLYTDNEPAIVATSVRALGDIGYNENNRVVEMINWVARKFDAALPTGALAIEILNAYEKLAPAAENNSGMIENIIRIAGNHNYMKPVRDRAYEVLGAVWSGGSAGNGSSASSSPSYEDDAYYSDDYYYEEYEE